MPLPYKPHLIKILAADEQINSGTVERTERSYSRQFMGQVTPLDAMDALERYGLELSNPALLMCEAEDVAVVGDHLECNGKLYRVERRPEIWDAEPITAHATQVLKALV